MIHVGIDEAGYGPTLGPLVVSAAAFKLSDSTDSAQLEGAEAQPHAPLDICPIDLWETLKKVVTRKPDRSRIPVDDSKKLYKPGKGLQHLEEGLLPFLKIKNPTTPKEFRELLRQIHKIEDPVAYLDQYPWYRDQKIELPSKTFTGYIKKLADDLQEELAENKVEFLGLASLPIHVREFNQTLAEHGNKSQVPFHAIGNLLRKIWRTYPDQAIDAVVDRQGGRIQYAPLLFKQLQPKGITIDTETPEASIYRLRGDKGQGALRVVFTRQGDAKSFAVALASMASKYLRELHMQIFNRYWVDKIQNLKPTAGYPQDARRFLSETQNIRKQLGTPDELLIRRR